MIGQGWLIGVSIAAPVGPIGVLCIRRSLQAGWAAGLATGLGAAVADAVYGAAAALGVSAVTTLLLSHQHTLGLIGGSYLLVLAWRTATGPVARITHELPGNRIRWIGAFGSTFLLTLTNPVTILSFVALLTSLTPSTQLQSAGAGWFVAGVFAGSAMWWLVLSGTVACLRVRVSERWLRIVKRLSAISLAAFAMLALWRGFHGLQTTVASPAPMAALGPYGHMRAEP